MSLNSANAMVEFAKELAKYADLITGFTMAQALALAYALGKKDELTKSILSARLLVRRSIPVAAVGYGTTVGLFGARELMLRAAAHQPHMILSTTFVLILARLLVVGIAAIIGYAALEMTREIPG
jgi:hypothetical protein